MLTFQDVSNRDHKVYSIKKVLRLIECAVYKEMMFDLMQIKLIMFYFEVWDISDLFKLCVSLLAFVMLHLSGSYITQLFNKLL